VRVLPHQYLQERGDLPGFFEQSQFDAAKAAKLIQPYKATAASARVGRNPATGEVVPAILIGTLAPGSGVFFSGMQRSGEIMSGPALTAAPRFGLAWDVFGDGKMAVRTGFGIFPGKIGDDATTSAFATQPPMLQNRHSVLHQQWRPAYSARKRQPDQCESGTAQHDDLRRTT